MTKQSKAARRADNEDRIREWREAGSPEHPARPRSASPEGGITAGERRALTIMLNRSAHVVAPGKPLERNQVTYRTAERLVVLEMAKPVPHDRNLDPDIMGAIVITKTGRAALDQPVPQGDVFLRRGGGYTTTHDEIDAGAVLDASSLKTHWVTEAAGRKAAVADRRAAGRRLGRQARAA